MNKDAQVIHPLHIPRELHSRIKAWAEAQSPAVTITAAYRHLLERGMTEIERKWTAACHGLVKEIDNVYRAAALGPAVIRPIRASANAIDPARTSIPAMIATIVRRDNPSCRAASTGPTSRTRART